MASLRNVWRSNMVLQPKVEHRICGEASVASKRMGSGTCFSNRQGASGSDQRSPTEGVVLVVSSAEWRFLAGW